jgi:hypothetical protein
MSHHAKVVGDENNGGSDLLLEIMQQVENLGLDGHVERRSRFICDQELRVAGERNGDHYPLPHAARELVRIFPRTPARFGDTDEV